MKATDLMIGDWCKIKLSFGTTWFTDKVGCINPNNEMEYEPIPLTPEILEKNGFVYNCFDRWMNNRYDVAIAVKDEFMFIWERIQLNYVHELQHALRLCGLNELANNFRV